MSDTSNELPSQGTSAQLPSCLRDSNKKRGSYNVVFPEEETRLVTGYFEAPNPWKYAENLTRNDLIESYRTSCEKHGVQPLAQVLKLLEEVEIDGSRCDTLNLRGINLEYGHCESLEEVLKRIQFKKIDLEATSLEDEGAVTLFDMIEYYEAAVQLDISSNANIGVRGWQSCSRMIKKTQCLEHLEARNVTLNEQYMPILSRALRIGTQLQTLKLENCGLSGRPIIILAAALKLNSGLRELYLSDNNLGVPDAIQLGTLLRANSTLQLLDISNNNIQDAGVGHISDGLADQSAQNGTGLVILILWNNHLTRNVSKHFARTVSRSKTLETLNVGHNVLTNECLYVMKDSLQQNRTLLRLGMQSTHLTCEGAIALAECIADNPVIQRIDLRDNNIQVAGLMALNRSMKVNQSVTQLDLDDLPRKKLDCSEEYKQLVEEIRGYCRRNHEQLLECQDTVAEETPEKRIQLPAYTSRKISLTCATLMRNVEAEERQTTLLVAEPPKRGGRLRSPAPSPVPSPSSSPVPSSPSPSPSRNRFQVSRVTEESPPTRSYSPSSSRFRVTVVQPSSVIPSVVVKPGNVTVGFTCNLSESDDSSGFSDDKRCDGIVAVESRNDDPSNNRPHSEPLHSNNFASVQTGTSDSTIQIPSDSSFVTSYIDCNAHGANNERSSSSLPTIPQLFVNRPSPPRSVGDSPSKLHEDSVVAGHVSPVSITSDISEDNEDLEVRSLMDPGSCQMPLISEGPNISVDNDNTYGAKTFLGHSSESEVHSEESLAGSSETVAREVENNDEYLFTPDTETYKSAQNSTPRRTRKVSWIPPTTQTFEQKQPSNLEKLITLFHNPSTIFSQTQPQYKPSTVIDNPQPVTNSNTSFLVTPSPLASTAKFESFTGKQESAKEKLSETCEISESQVPVPDIINNNKDKNTSDCISPSNGSVRVWTKSHEDENFNLSQLHLSKTEVHNTFVQETDISSGGSETEESICHKLKGGTLVESSECKFMCTPSKSYDTSCIISESLSVRNVAVNTQFIPEFTSANEEMTTSHVGVSSSPKVVDSDELQNITRLDPDTTIDEPSSVTSVNLSESSDP